jgi:hypothetical protein
LQRIALRPSKSRTPPSISTAFPSGLSRATAGQKSYIASYGNRCWEADVLPGNVIEQAIDTNIQLWLNERLWKRRDSEIEQARKLL